MSHILVIGASSGIAAALIQQLTDQHERLVVVSRKPEKLPDIHQNTDIETHQCDYSDGDIKRVAAELQQRNFSKVYICNGILHRNELMPEKRLEDLRPDQFAEVMYANALTPLLWLKHLKPVLKGQQPCVVTLFSARVGSISDNKLGGWYAYRASKAALNMMVKNAAIEYARIAKQTRFLLFHPGTTDTPLSEPFQKSVPEGKLFTPEFVADRLLSISNELGHEPGIDYLDWDGQNIAW
jgi:NAD(P)-dependent dehydrogenase (short-subunit alcohol dehydrogenase family)